MSANITSNSRRRALKYSILSLVPGALGLLTGWSSDDQPLAEGPDSGTLLPDGLKAIGREYLKYCPAERSRTVLLGSIQSRLGESAGRPSGLSQADLKIIIADDFQTDDVVYLKGWALSRTEARLAALSVV